MNEPRENGEKCPNCGGLLTPSHRYCQYCGQERIRKNDNIQSVFTHFLGDYFTFDSKIIGSFKPLLLKPGMLTSEFIIGRRARYIPPLRLYIFVSIIFFLVLSWGNDTPAVGSMVSDDALLWNEFFGNYLPKVFFLLLPVFALITGLHFRKAELGYVTHLIFALHFHSFVFILLLFYLIISRILADWGLFYVNGVLLTAILLFTLAYLLFSLKRVFAMRWGGVIFRFISILLLYTAMLMAALLSITAFITLRG